MLTILKKEIKAYFSTPFGFIFMGIFLLMSGIAFTTYNLLGRRADIYGMLGIMRTLSITAFPVLTMRLLAEERHMGTDQLLLTSRLSVAAVVVGKYLAALFVLFVTLLANSLYVIILFFYGEPTIGAILGSYAGFFLLGASFTAICLFASGLAENQVTSALAAFGMLFALVIIGSLSASVRLPVLRPHPGALGGRPIRGVDARNLPLGASRVLRVLLLRLRVPHDQSRGKAALEPGRLTHAQE
jgi:ABC-2 type transport system permease protein